MRLKMVMQPPSTNTHSELVAALGWNSSNELITCSDDQTIRVWNMDGEPLNVLTELDTYVTDVHWLRTGTKRSGNDKEKFLVACTDGTFRIVFRANGKVEKTIEAHKGAVTAIRWSYEGTSICTSGEDGYVRIWSKTGMKRTQLPHSGTGQCIYSLSWSPNSDAVLFAAGQEVTIIPVVANAKQIRWKAHDGTVLKVDWNPVNNLIVTGGEDCRYRVWDAYGRPLYSSERGDSIVTSVRWSPGGAYFAVGAYNNMRLCDKTGWSYSLHPTDTGSVFNIAWTSDGTIVAGAGGNGTVAFGHLTERAFEWQAISGRLDEDNIIRVHDINSEGIQDLSFRDKVVKMSVGYDHLIVATTAQCKIFSTQTWAEPVANDVKDMITLVAQCEKHFLTVDSFAGIQLFNYEGRVKCRPAVPGLKPAYLNETGVSLCNDFLAVLDQSDRQTIHVIDANTGKPLQPIPGVGGQRGPSTLKHTVDVLDICVSQAPSAPHMRKIAIIDKNHDLWISYVRKPNFAKLGTMVTNCVWNDQADMLAAVCDGDLVVWLYPQAAFFDPQLAQRTRETKVNQEFGKNPQIAHFFGKTCTVRRTDGARVATGVSPYPLMLFAATLRGDWENAVRLCRFVKDVTLWATLACMALDADQLDTAEVACAAIHEVDKLKYIVTVKEIPAPEIQRAQLMLLKRQHRDAETVLLQAGFVYRAIKINIKAFKWERALELAVRYKKHVDTVLGYRQRSLAKFGKEETLPEYKKLADTAVDWETIKSNAQLEKRQEAGMS
jgi:intraflagellar transport protein 80